MEPFCAIITTIKGKFDMAVISITGKPCSGKSTIAKLLEKDYGFKRISMGDMFKEEAKRRGMSTEEFTSFRVNDSSFDVYMDKQIPSFIKKFDGQNVIIESRVAWHFLPDSFKVFIDLDEDEIAKRLVDSDRVGKEKYTDFDEAKRSTISRWNNELEVYKKTYDIDCSDLTNYDLVLNSKNKTPQQLADKICKSFQKFLKKEN